MMQRIASSTMLMGASVKATPALAVPAQNTRSPSIPLQTSIASPRRKLQPSRGPIVHRNRPVLPRA